MTTAQCLNSCCATWCNLPEAARVAIQVVAWLVAAPIVGGFLAGLDRRLSAWMQGRQGPPLRQPFFDVMKLMQKESLFVNRFHSATIVLFFLAVLATGGIFFAGGDILLVVFALTLAGLFLVLGGYVTGSPYAHIGAEREILQMVAYEPMVILMAAGLYMATGTFDVSGIIDASRVKGVPLFYVLPGVFIGYMFILTIKLRKSPFDLSTSHHGHQELVKGVTTEFSGKALAIIEIAHWYENVLLLGFIYLFFANNILLGVGVALAAYLLEIFIDNVNVRAKWKLMFGSAWVVTLVAGALNILVLFLVKHLGA